MAVRAIGVKGAGFFYSGGIDQIVSKCNRIKGCTATSHLYGIFFMYTNVSMLTRTAIQAIDNGDDVVMFGNSMGGDAIGRIAYNVKQQRPKYIFPFLYYIDPTPLVWNVESNVREAINPYNTRVAQLGGGRVRAQNGNTFTKITRYPQEEYHTNMDDLAVYHNDIVKRISALLLVS